MTADLAPFVLAAPTGEVEAFLSTQLVDEMRHAVFFDRWMAEVMGLEAEEMRDRLKELEESVLTLEPLALPLRRVAARRRQSDQGASR